MLYPLLNDRISLEGPRRGMVVSKAFGHMDNHAVDEVFGILKLAFLHELQGLFGNGLIGHYVCDTNTLRFFHEIIMIVTYFFNFINLLIHFSRHHIFIQFTQPLWCFTKFIHDFIACINYLVGPYGCIFELGKNTNRFHSLSFCMSFPKKSSTKSRDYNDNCNNKNNFQPAHKLPPAKGLSKSLYFGSDRLTTPSLLGGRVEG